MDNYNSEQIDLDNRDRNYSNKDVLMVLNGCTADIDKKDNNFFYDGEEINIYQRIQTICYIIRYIKDKNLLGQVIAYLKTFDLIDGMEKEFENELICLYTKGIYSDIDIVKVRAIYYSLTSQHKLVIKTLKFPNSIFPIPLEIKLKNRIIEHNFQKVLESIQKNNLLNFETNISKLLINEQKKEIDKWIRSAMRVGLSKGTSMFNFEIDYLKKVSKHLIEPIMSGNNQKNVFSVLEWATIFYYADETKLLPHYKFLSNRMKDFIQKHCEHLSDKNFRQKYYNAKKRINVNNDFPIDKLECIIPFLETNYVQAVNKIHNDITFLQNELLD